MKRGIIGLFLVLFALSACQKKDIYDPNYNPDLGVSVPDDFDWSTTKSLTVNVEVNDEYNGKRLYFVRVYIKNPKDGGLPLANEKANMDLPFSEKIVIPLSVDKLYIEQCFINANAVETVVMKEIAIKGEVIDYSFKASAKNIGSSRISSRDKDKNNKLKIKKGEERTINDTSLDNYEVEIEKGGTLWFAGGVELKNCNVDNDGTLIVNGDLTLKKTDLENDNSVHVTGNLDVDNESEFKMDDSSCTIVEGTATLKSDKDIEMEELAYFSCSNLELLTKGVTVTMETSAWLRVTGQLMASDDCKIEYDEEDDDDYILGTKWGALLQIGEIKNQGNSNLKVDKEILVECKSPGKAEIDKGSLVDDASKYITIPGTNCNDSGIGVDNPSYLGSDYTFAMEDQYPNKGDYDMNDIVVFISGESSYSSLKNRVTIKGKLIAAGANLSIIPYVGMKNTRQDSKPLFTNEAGSAMDVYHAFGGEGSICPVNTNAEGGKSFSAVPFVVELNNVTEKLNIGNLDFYIRVNNHEIDCTTKNENNDIFGIVVPGKFKYPKERYNVSKCYGEPFRHWIESNGQDSANWYEGSAQDVISF